MNLDSWRIPLSRPDIDDSDRAAVARVMNSSVLSLGPELVAFEQEFAARYPGRTAIAVSNGTAGLYLALRALQVTSGEVLTPSFGFVGTSHAIRWAGATPRYVDVSPETLCITPESLDAAWTPNVTAVLSVDIFGTPAPNDEIAQWAKARGIVLVEDSCEAIGGECQGEPVGMRGEVSVFAFYPNKQMTTGEGGMVLCRHPEVADRIGRHRNQARGDGEFQFSGEGFNFRLCELQAALGRSQLARLDTFLEQRAQVAQRYRDLLQGIPGLATLPEVRSGDTRSWFVFPVFVEEPNWRSEIREQLSARGIQTSPYFPAVHTFSPYDQAPRGPLSVTEAVCGRSFAIPFHNRISPREQAEVADALHDALRPKGGESLVSLPTLLATFA